MQNIIDNVKATFNLDTQRLYPIYLSRLLKIMNWKYDSEMFRMTIAKDSQMEPILVNHVDIWISKHSIYLWLMNLTLMRMWLKYM